MEWKEVRLGDVVKIYDAQRVPLSSQERQKRQGVYPYYGAQGIIDHIDDYLFDGEYILVAEDGNNVKTRQEDIAQIAKGRFWVNNHAHILKSAINQELLCYIINNTDISGFVTGSAQPKLNQANLVNIPIRLPSESIQEKASSILSSLDSKIETNNKINAKLEEMAQALFKSWFVDFEPFKDGKFVESELGMIPEGWRVGKLGEIAYVEKKSVNPSKQSDTLFSHYSLPAFDDNKLPAKQYGNEIMSNKCAFTNRTTLLSKLNPHIKRIWYVDQVEDNPICSTEFLPFKAKDEDCSAFLYSYLVSDTFYKVALSMVQGATNSHQRLDAKSLLDFEFAINKEAIMNFSSKVAPMLTTICKNRVENLRLSQLRDTLLPKLMNGEIEI